MRAVPSTQVGAAMVEWLIAVPVILLLGLGMFQASELLIARFALRHALIEAARAGSVANARADAIERGLADGLAPWLFGADDAAALAVARARARAQVADGRRAGWIALRQVSPTAASFDDWGEPARDSQGRPAVGRQIAFDALQTEHRLRMPASGVAGHRGAAPIGRASGQTLADANLLQLELTYGVPVRVPFAGRLLVAALRRLDDCPGASSVQRVGPLVLEAAAAAGPRGRWTCAFYGDEGAAEPRIPVRIEAILRMQSTAQRGGSLLAFPASGRA